MSVCYKLYPFANAKFFTQMLILSTNSSTEKSERCHHWPRSCFVLHPGPHSIYLAMPKRTIALRSPGGVCKVLPDNHFANPGACWLSMGPSYTSLRPALIYTFYTTDLNQSCQLGQQVTLAHFLLNCITYSQAIVRQPDLCSPCQGIPHYAHRETALSKPESLIAMILYFIA